ncbi:MAG: site-2 protease family protein [Planctomycetota bacterium]|nr:site-2 protease family protein [Planctomycetota bacterium]
MDFNIIDILLRAPVIFFSLTIHEFMHAWTAWKCGDDTALRQGRVTLNPLAHLDPIGTVLLFFGPIGWAKPVPVQPYNFYRPRRDDILVSGAGVAMNLALGILLAVVVRALVWQNMLPESRLAGILWGMMGWGILLNLGLAMFNLLPLHPLDGSHVLSNLLPATASARFEESRNTTMIILGILLLLNWLVFPGFLYTPAVHLMVLLAGDTGTGHLLANMWLYTGK